MITASDILLLADVYGDAAALVEEKLGRYLTKGEFHDLCDEIDRWRRRQKTGGRVKTAEGKGSRTTWGLTHSLFSAVERVFPRFGRQN